MATRNLDSNLGYDTDVLQEKHDERQASLSGRQYRHVEALFRILHTVGFGRLHDALGNHRISSIIPASIRGAVAGRPNSLLWLVGRRQRQPGNGTASEGCLRSAWRH